MDEIALLKEIVDLKESLAWFNETLGQCQQRIIQLKVQLYGQQGQDTEKMKQQRERILKLEVKLNRRVSQVVSITKEWGRQQERILELEDKLVDAYLRIREQDLR